MIDSGDLVRNYLRPTSILPGGRYLLVAADSYSEKGWQVNVAWDASRLDPWPDLAIETYSMWRALDGTSAKALTE